MSPRARTYLQFGMSAVLSYVVIAFGSGILAQTMRRDTRFVQAVSEQVEGIQPIWLIIELLPFVLLGALCASLARDSPSRAAGLFGVGVILFAALYLHGNFAFERYLAAGAWTAASLSGGLIPFKALGILVFLVIARGLLGTKSEANKA